MSNVTNKYSHLSIPQASFDFHDRGIMTEREIGELAKTFVNQSVSKGLRRILIITGKGVHSKGTAVIGSLLRKFLPTLPQVISVMTARRDRGGEGALEVELG